MFLSVPRPPAGEEAPGALTPADRTELLALGQGRARRTGSSWITAWACRPCWPRELAFEAFGEVDAPVSRDPAALLDKLERLLARLSQGEAVPTLLVREGKPVDFSFLAHLQYGPGTESGLSHLALLDALPGPGTADQVPRRGRISKPSPRPGSGWPGRWPSRRRSWPPQATGTDRMCGDLITANLYRMEKGGRCCGRKTITTLTAARWRSRWTLEDTPSRAPPTIRTIPKPRPPRPCLPSSWRKRGPGGGLSGQRSGQRVPGGGDRDLEEIRQELVETGYLRRAKAKDRMKRPGAKPLSFPTAGLRISVGRNNLQNDRLTTKQAGKWDYWFHTQKIHGAHVILWTEGPAARRPEPPGRPPLWPLGFSQGREGRRSLWTTPR